MTKTESISTQANASAFGVDDVPARDGDWLAYAVGLQSYRCLRRFVTRHVVPHADDRIRRLLRLDEGQRGTLISTDPRALEAWAVALWTFDLEREAPRRLWSDPGRRSCPEPSIGVKLERCAMGMELTVKTASGPLREGQAQWLLGHAVLATLRRRFSIARALARGMAEAEEAALSKDLVGRNKLYLSGEVLIDGALRFTVEAQPQRASLMPCRRPGKSERRQAFEERLRERQTELCRCCVGVCLRFSWRNGWTVATSSVPDLAAGVSAKRHPLFVPGRPAFLLFAVPDGWCARLIDSPLEVRDAEPWKVIDTLRHAYMKYTALQASRVAGTAVSAQARAEAPLIAPTPVMEVTVPLRKRRRDTPLDAVHSSADVPGDIAAVMSQPWHRARPYSESDLSLAARRAPLPDARPVSGTHLLARRLRDQS